MSTLRVYTKEAREPLRDHEIFFSKMFTKGKKISLMPVALSLVSFASAHTGNDEFDHHGMMGDMYGMMSGSWGYGGMFFGWLTGLLVIVVLVLLIAWLIKQVNKK